MSSHNNELPEGFKMTELGPLPQNWEIGTLGSGRYFQILPSGIDDFTGQKKYLSTSSIQGWKIESPECLIYYGNRPSRANMQPRLNTVWFAKMIGTVKVYCFTESNRAEVIKYILSTGFCGIHCKEDVDPEYLKFIFLSDYFNTLKDSLCSGTTQRAINNDSISSITLAFPPFPEQRAITRVLSAIQKAIDTQDKIIAAVRELKKSLMRHLFTYGPVLLSETERVPLKETEIGLLPEHWEVVRLGEVSEHPQYGYTASATERIVGPKFLRITDVQDSHVDWSLVPYCEINDTEVARYCLRQGDILFARIGATTGKTYYFNGTQQAVFGSYLIRVTTKTPLLPEYLSHFTATEIYWNQINASKGGRLKQGINIPILQSLLLPLPPLAEQQEIARILTAVDAKIEKEEKRKVALQTLFKTMLHLLMTGKVRIKELEALVA